MATNVYMYICVVPIQRTMVNINMCTCIYVCIYTYMSVYPLFQSGNFERMKEEGIGYTLFRPSRSRLSLVNHPNNYPAYFAWFQNLEKTS